MDKPLEEENRIKLQALNCWQAREYLLKRTLSHVPIDVTEIISQYLQITWFAPPSTPVVSDEELNNIAISESHVISHFIRDDVAFGN